MTAGLNTLGTDGESTSCIARMTDSKTEAKRIINTQPIINTTTGSPPHYDHHIAEVIFEQMITAYNVLALLNNMEPVMGLEPTTC